MPTIRPDELDARLGGDRPPFVLDVRPEPEYRDDHVEGSHNLPVYHDLAAGEEDALRDRLDELPRDRTVVTVCRLGLVARTATDVLHAEGFDAATLSWGMAGWRGYRRGSLGHRLRSLYWRLRGR